MLRFFSRFGILVVILLAMAPVVPAQFAVPKAEARQITAATPMPGLIALPSIITPHWPPLTVEMRAAQIGNQVTFVMLVTNRSDRTYSYEVKARLPAGARLLACHYGTHRTDWRQCGLDGLGNIGWINVSGIRGGAVVGPYTFTVEVPGASASSYAWVNFFNNSPAGSWTGPIVVTPAVASPTVRAASTALGTILVDERGMTLYMFTRDVQETSTSNCYGACAANWPPLLTTDRPVAGPGVRPELLGVTTRTDGTLQVTYNGWPLYYWFQDAQPGDTLGQNVGGVWFVLRPDGTAVR